MVGAVASQREGSGLEDCWKFAQPEINLRTNVFGS